MASLQGPAWVGGGFHLLRGNMTNETGEIKTRRAAAFMGNLVAALGLLVIGYPQCGCQHTPCAPD